MSYRDLQLFAQTFRQHVGKYNTDVGLTLS